MAARRGKQNSYGNEDHKNDMTNRDKILRAIENSKARIEAVDQGIIGETIGVAQALDDLRKSLDDIETCLDKRAFSEASSIGYKEVATAFVFLQRTLGGLQQAQYEKEQLVSDIAVQSGVGVYEEVAPFVDDVLASSKALSAEEKARNKEKAREWLQERKQAFGEFIQRHNDKI